MKLLQHAESGRLFAVWESEPHARYLGCPVGFKDASELLAFVRRVFHHAGFEFGAPELRLVPRS